MLAGLPPASPSSSTAAAAVPAVGTLASTTWKAIVACRRVAVAVRHREGRAGRRNRARRRGVRRERVRAVGLHLDEAGANVDRLRVAVRAEHQQRAVDVGHRGAVGAASKVQRAGHRRPFRDVLRGLGAAAGPSSSTLIFNTFEAVTPAALVTTTLKPSNIPSSVPVEFAFGWSTVLLPAYSSSRSPPADCP